MRSGSWADLLPVVLDAVVEAAWVAAAYLLVQIAWGGSVLVVGVAQFTLVVAAGIGLGAFLRRRGARAAAKAAARAPGESGSGAARAGRGDTVAGASRLAVAVATCAVVVAAVLGWMIAPEVRAALASLDVARAATLHPGGWLVGLALLRGLAHGDVADEEGGPGRALRIGLPVLVAVWLLGRSIGGPDRSLFQDTAMPDTIAFMAAGLLAAGVAGMRALASGRDGGGRRVPPAVEATRAAGEADPVEPDWRRNRQWILLLLTVVVGMVIVALPVISAPGQGVVAALLELLWVAVELVILVVVVRSIPRAVSFSIPFLLAGLVVVLVLRLIGFRPDALAQLVARAQEIARIGAGSQNTPGPVDAARLLGVVVLLVVVAVVIVLVSAWLRRRIAVPASNVFEERSVVVEPTTFRMRRPTLRRSSTRRDRPTDAVSAYRAVLEQLDADPELRRALHESPAEHAARIGGWATGGRAVRRLAIDYELARFAGATLTAREEARSIDRWRRIDAALRRRPKPAAGVDRDDLDPGGPGEGRRSAGEVPRPY